MALLSDRTRNATIRARVAMDILIIPKADFNKLRQSVPAFGDVFTELATRRAVAGSPQSSAEPSTLGGCGPPPNPDPDLSRPELDITNSSACTATVQSE